VPLPSTVDSACRFAIPSTHHIPSWPRTTFVYLSSLVLRALSARAADESHFCACSKLVYNPRVRAHNGHSAETVKGTMIGQQVLLLALEFLDKVVDETVAESSPPRWVSPAVALTSKIPSPIVRRGCATAAAGVRCNGQATELVSFGLLCDKRD